MAFIYKVTNKVNGKLYVGQTRCQFSKRKREHINDANIGRGYKLENAINKYGKDNFIWEILYETENIEELDPKEIFFIQKYKANNKKYGYNSTEGGEGSYIRTPKTITLLKESRKGQHSGKNNPMYGKKHTKEAKKKMGVNKGKKLSEEQRRKISESLKGKKHTEETKGKMSAVAKKRKRNSKGQFI